MAHRSMRTWSAPIWLIVMATLLLFSPGLSAQDNATITGTVTDASGAVVPNADISLDEPGTGQIREAKSNEAGVFRFANVGSRNLHSDRDRSGIPEIHAHRHRCERRADRGSRHRP